MPLLRLSFVLLLTAALLHPGRSPAQEEAGPEEERATAPGIEEIVVTAERRETLVQSTPVAISAFTGADLDNQGYYDFEDVSFNIPNVQFGRQLVGSGGFTIRGVSSSSGDRATAFHVDGIYINTTTAAEELTFFDIERVEVLRGPQGTLYGRNATGGSINVITNRPGPEFEVFGDVQLGTYDQLLARAVVNVPILDDLLYARVSVLSNNRDGYQRNLASGVRNHDANDAADFGIRSQIRLLPLDSLDFTVRYTYAQRKGVGNAFKFLGPHPTSTTLGVGGFTLELDQYCTSTAAREGGCFVSPNPENDRNVYLDYQARNDDWDNNVNLQGIWDLPEIPIIGETQVKVIGSWLNQKSFGSADQDGSDGAIAWSFTTVDTEFVRVPDPNEPAGYTLQPVSGCIATDFAAGASAEAAGCSEGHNDLTEWVAEAQWRSAGSGNLEWLLGFFFLNTNQDTNGFVASKPAPWVNEIFGVPPPFPPDLLKDVQVPILGVGNQQAQSWAIFGQASYTFGEDSATIWDNWTPTFGLRYTRDNKSASNQTPTVDLQTPVGITVRGQSQIDVIDDHQTWDAVTGRAQLQWDWSDDNMAYLAASRGYKAGFINTTLADPVDPQTALPNADPEFIWSLEGGSKNRFFDNRLQVNLTGFWYDYQDLQVSQLVNLALVTQNAAEATIWGFEGEFIALPFDGWAPTLVEGFMLTLNVGYLNATYDEFDSCLLPELSSDPTVPNEVDCSGNRMVRAPPYTVTLIANWPFDFGRFGTITPNIQFYASGKVFFRPTNCPDGSSPSCKSLTQNLPRGTNEDSQDPYQLLNLRLTWQSADGRIQVMGFVDNVFDKDVIQSQVTGSNQIGSPVQVYFDNPRTAGVRLAVAW